MSQTTISVNVAFDKIWTLAASMKRGNGWKHFACISRCHCNTLEVGRLYALSVAPIADRFRLLLPECKWVPLSEHVLHQRYGQLMAWNFLACCNTCYKQSVVGDIIISFAQHYFYWNLCKAMFLFQLISVLLIRITFYTYLANIVFFRATWPLNHTTTNLQHATSGTVTDMITSIISYIVDVSATAVTFPLTIYICC